MSRVTAKDVGGSFTSRPLAVPSVNVGAGLGTLWLHGGQD